MNSNEEDFKQENRTFTNEIQTNLQNDMIEPENLINDDQPNYKFAGFWMRFWAYLLDIVVIGSIDRIIVYPIFRMFDLSLSEANMFAPVAIITAIVFYALFCFNDQVFWTNIRKNGIRFKSCFS